MATYTRKLNIKGAQRDVIASFFTIPGKNFITITLSTAFNGFSFSKSYNLRDGTEPNGLNIGNDFVTSANKEYDDQAAIVALLISRGFTAVPE